MLRKQLFLAVVFCLTDLGSALAADVSGTWTISGPVNPTCTLIQNGSNLTGACRGANAEGPLSGTFDGQTAKWTFHRNSFAGQTLPAFEFTATLNADGLSGSLINANGVTIPFSARQVPGTAPIQLATNAQPQAPSSPLPQSSQQPTATQQTSAIPAQAPQPSVNINPPKTVFNIDVDGSATHLQSDLVCSATSLGWRRVSTIAYDATGFDVSCGYRNPAGSTITIYINRHPPSQLNAIFQGSKDAIPKSRPDAISRTQTAVAPPGFQWLSAGFSQRDGAEDSDLFLTQLPDNWQFEIRATYKPDDMPAVNAAMADLSDKLTRTAGTHLAACAASLPPTRSGVRNSDVDILMAYSSATAATAKLTVVSPRNDAVWCAETSFRVGDFSYVFWRNIGPANEGPVDRITNISNGLSDPVIVLRNAAQLVDAMVAHPQLGGGKHPADSAAVYGVVIDSAQATLVVGLFDGRPSLKDIATLALADRHGVYAQVKKPEGSITIDRPF